MIVKGTENEEFYVNSYPTELIFVQLATRYRVQSSFANESTRPPPNRSVGGELNPRPRMLIVIEFMVEEQ